MHIPVEKDDADDGNGKNDGPDAFDHFPAVVEEEGAHVSVSEELLDGKQIKQVVSESDVEDRHGSNIEHRVEVGNLAYHWDLKEVLVIQCSHFARKHCVRGIALARTARECKIGKPGLREQENAANNVAVEEHLFDALLWSHWVDDATDGVVVDEDESCVAEDLGQVLDLGAPVEHWRRRRSRVGQVVNRSAHHQEGDDKAKNGRHDLEGFCVFDVAEAKEQ